MKKILCVLGIMLSAFGQVAGQNILSLIPYPENVTIKEGVCPLEPSVKISVGDSSLSPAALLFAGFMKSDFGLELKTGGGRNAIRLEIDNSMGQEAYALSVRPSGITVRGDKAGVFYGLQTLRQMIASDGAKITVPCAEITDRPRFSHRGLMLDCGRYYFPVEYIKSFIDRMVQYKFNVFHWHLTEDAGWRMEIEEYPELTRVGAWRSSTQRSVDKKDQDRLPHGGFYSKAEIKDVIAYATERHVSVIPEIDMPGHTMSVLAAYPQLSCTGGPFTVPTEWGVKEDVLCLGNEDTYSFIENVLSEVVDVFPSEYIHIGGDEAPKKRWKECPKCQAKIKAEGLKDEYELQAYFIRHVEKFLNSHGRRIIGWDEIRQGGGSPTAAIMGWSNENAGPDAARAGNNVIMSTKWYSYFDYASWQVSETENEPAANSRYLPLEKAYRFDPVAGLTEEEWGRVMGVQAHLWGEYIHSIPKIEYMAYPRVLATAETGWSREKDYDGFLARLPERLAALERDGIMFRIPEPEGWNEAKIVGSNAVISLKPLVSGAEILYTTDGSDPTLYGVLYREPIEVPLGFSGVNVKCVVRLSSGRSSAVYTVTAAE